MQWIFWYDWLLLPVYFFLLRKLVFSFGNKRYEGKKLQYFKYGFIAKMIGALGFAFYHQYIYQGGDTLLFFDTSIKLADIASSNFSQFLKSILDYSPTNVDLRFDTLDDVVFNDSNFFVVRVSAVLAFICFKSYMPILLIFSTLSYIGIWYAYSAVCKMYPNAAKELAIVFLFIPSVVLWGSGLGKDSLTLGGTCLIFGALLKIFLIPKQRKFINIIFVLIGYYVVFIIKPYIIYSFMGAFTIGILFQRIVLIKSKNVKMIVRPLLIIIGLLFSSIIYNYISDDPKFGLDLIAEQVARNNKNLGEKSGAGSAYDLGLNTTDIGNFKDIIPIFPKSITITLFRPFLWEVNNPAMLLSAIESLFFLMVFLYILFKNKIFGIIPIFIRQPITISCLLYTLIFAGLVGISSGNFGTLVRYKIPCLPFFGLMLVLLYKKNNLAPTTSYLPAYNETMVKMTDIKTL